MYDTNARRGIRTPDTLRVKETLYRWVIRAAPPAGFEPATRRLTVVGSTAELQRIVCLFFFDGLEVKTIISFLHIVNSIHVFLKTHIFEMLEYTFHLSYKEKKIDRSSWSPTKLPMITINAHKKRKDNDSSRIRTYDRLLRRQLLYPAELLSRERGGHLFVGASYLFCLSTQIL